MLFPVERVPYVGLSINLGGWPVDRPAYYNLGLEPCNGYPDRLDLAIASGDCAVAAPGERLEWQLDLHVGRCPDVLGGDPAPARGERWPHEHDQGHRQPRRASRPRPSRT